MWPQLNLYGYSASSRQHGHFEAVADALLRLFRARALLENDTSLFNAEEVRAYTGDKTLVSWLIICMLSEVFATSEGVEQPILLCIYIHYIILYKLNP